MATYFVETFRPPHPERGLKHAVYSYREFSLDVLNAGMTAVFEVSQVSTKPEAIAAVLEHAAGYGTSVRLIHGGTR